jgi:hypothetical protein
MATFIISELVRDAITAAKQEPIAWETIRSVALNLTPFATDDTERNAIKNLQEASTPYEVVAAANAIKALFLARRA